MAEFKLGKFKFDSRIKAEEYEKGIRNCKKPFLNKPTLSKPANVFRLEGDEEEFVVELLCRHPEVERKISLGITGVGVRYDTPPNIRNLQYVVIQDDGWFRSFSIKTCFDGKISTPKADYIQALRWLIQPQMNRFSNNNKTDPNEEVDHFPISFSELVEDFFEDLNITEFTQDMTQRDPNNCQYPTLKDTDMAETWKEYHFDRAELRMYDKHQNRSEGRRK